MLVGLAVLLAGCVGGGDDTGKGAQPDPVALPEDCSALAAQDGATAVSDVAGLRAAVGGAASGDVIALDAGTYDLSDGPVAVPAGVTLRSASGDAATVVLEGSFATAELVQLGEGATLAEVTLSRPDQDAVTIRAASGARVYGVHVVDPGGRAVAVLPERGVYSDDATIGCVTVSRTSECAIGIEGVQTEGTRVYGTTVDQPACDQPGVKFATGSKDTVIERSVVTTAGTVGVQLGDTDYDQDERRTHADACEATGHHGGVVRNVFAVGGGVRVEDACEATIAHVTAWGGMVSWSFATDLAVTNTLAELLDTGGATLSGNLTPTAADFVDAGAGDLHLAAGSAAIDAGVVTDVTDDVDGEARDASPDVGADEVAE